MKITRMTALWLPLTLGSFAAGGCREPTAPRNDAWLTDLHVVEDIAGTIIGVEAEGILRLTGGVLGTTVLTQDFRTIVGVTSTGFGRCELVSIDLAPISVEVLDPLATVDVPAADVTARGSGAVRQPVM